MSIRLLPLLFLGAAAHAQTPWLQGVGELHEDHGTVLRLPGQEYRLVPGVGVLPAPAAAAAAASTGPASQDFDFVLGTWQVTSRRLAKPLSSSTAWTTGAAVQTARPLPHGEGNIDEFLIDGKPIGGSLRLYDRASGQWLIYWAAARDGVLQLPVRGRFTDGVGVFEGEDSYGGRPIRVRYTWTGTRGVTPRWEQAFSIDGGKSWEVNWIMEFRRAL